MTRKRCVTLMYLEKPYRLVIDDSTTPEEEDAVRKRFWHDQQRYPRPGRAAGLPPSIPVGITAALHAALEQEREEAAARGLVDACEPGSLEICPMHGEYVVVCGLRERDCGECFQEAVRRAVIAKHRRERLHRQLFNHNRPGEALDSTEVEPPGAETGPGSFRRRVWADIRAGGALAFGLLILLAVLFALSMTWHNRQQATDYAQEFAGRPSR